VIARPANTLCALAVLSSLTALPLAESEAFNRYAHVELFKKSVAHLKDFGLTEVHGFYTGNNSDSVDITVLADAEDEIMWVDIHSTTEPDDNAADYLIDNAHPYCWNDSLERLEDQEDIEACKDCVRAIVDQFSDIALPRPGQETVYFPSRGAARSRYDFRWELPLSFLVGLVNPECDLLATRYGVLAQNSLRAEITIHSAKFKSLEYLNYAIGAWKDYDCETSLRWLTRITNYDPHHSMTSFKSYDYLTEDWVSVDMDGDMDVDYEDAQAWGRELLNYAMYYQFLFCDLVDGRLGLAEPGSVAVDSGDIIEHHSFLMNQRATYSASLWPQLDELIDYFNGNARDAVDELLPRIVTSTADLLADFFYNVVSADHPEFLLVCVEGVPRDLEVVVRCELDLGDRAFGFEDRIRGEHFKYYEIPVSAGITAENCAGCDTVMGYRFDRMVICDGISSRESHELTHVAERAATVHLIYTPYWKDIDASPEPAGDTPRNGQALEAFTPGSSGLALSQNTPNPARNETRIIYSLSRPEPVRLKLYSTAGELVRTLVQENQSAGNHSVTLDTSGLPAGVYFYRLEASGTPRTKKLFILR